MREKYWKYLKRLGIVVGILAGLVTIAKFFSIKQRESEMKEKDKGHEIHIVRSFNLSYGVD